MVNKITKKAILKIKETVDAYAKEMAVVAEKISTIDEKYRKLAEKETKELKAALADLEAEQEIWCQSLTRYDADVVNEVLGESVETTVTEEPEAVEESAPTAEVEESIVDTLFDDNNTAEEDTETETEPESTPSVEEDDEPEFESDSSDEGLTEIWPDEATENVAEEPVEETVEEEPVAEATIEEDEWPSMPEEWK